MKDPLDDFNKSLGKLDDKLNKTFRPQTIPNNVKQINPKQTKLITEKDKDALIKLAKQTNLIIHKLHQQITKNQIPKDYDAIMAMRDRLELELRRQKEIDQAIKQIKQMQQDQKEYRKAKRKQKLNNIKQFIKKLTFTNNNKHPK